VGQAPGRLGGGLTQNAATAIGFGAAPSPHEGAALTGVPRRRVPFLEADAAASLEDSTSSAVGGARNDAEIDGEVDGISGADRQGRYP
jgi:hypothetical protein